MSESVIIQKLIQVGQMLERGELEYSGAEADTKHYLEQYAALHQPLVSGSFPSDEDISNESFQQVTPYGRQTTANDRRNYFKKGAEWMRSKLVGNGR